MEEQFKILYHEHFAALSRFARFYCADMDEATNAVQQVFLNVWERKEDLLQQQDLKAYLFTSVRNRVFSDQRRKSLSRELDEAIEDNHISAHQKLEIKDLSAQINQVISALPDKCRYIFELSRYEKMSYKMIASHLDISVKTVENQISKALKILRIEIYGPGN